MFNFSHFLRGLCLLILAVSTSSLAACIRVTSTTSLSREAIAAGYTAAGWSGACDICNGNMGLPSIISINTGNHFQAPGTLIASAVGNFLTGATNVPYASNQILYRCQLADAGSLYEVYATNGDNAYTGAYAATEVEGAYFDVSMNVAARMINLTTGEYYSRYWKQRPFTPDEWYQDDRYIYIPASAFSNVLYELFKISATNWYLNGAAYYVDGYAQPRGYVAFKGPGLITNNLQPGMDSAAYIYGWYGQWPGAWGTWQKVTWVRGAFCRVKDYTPRVLLPVITASELRAGATVQRPFNITIECESGAISSTASSSLAAANVAMGFLVNHPTAVSAANALGLTTRAGGLTWLLDNNYGSSGAASGVGIRIYNQRGAPINLLPDRTSSGNGNERGWYSYKDLTSLVSSGDTDIYSGEFTASLEAINGQTITSGRVYAQLQVVVSFQ